jgi:hypothetical protein
MFFCKKQYFFSNCFFGKVTFWRQKIQIYFFLKNIFSEKKREFGKKYFFEFCVPKKLLSSPVKKKKQKTEKIFFYKKVFGKTFFQKKIFFEFFVTNFCSKKTN